MSVTPRRLSAFGAQLSGAVPGSFCRRMKQPLPNVPVAPLPPAGDFPTTHWSAVLAAGDSEDQHAQAALEELCAAYWYPLYVYARQRDYPPEEAEDLTQEFFVQLVHKKFLCGIKREGARFRSYLLVIFKCFLANIWRHNHARKRGGGQIPLPIDEAAETRYQQDLVVVATPETLFDRQWAWTVLDRVFSRLREEYCSSGKAKLFDQLRSCLPGAEQPASYPQIAAALHMNEPAVRKAVQRLRRRCGELLRSEIADTVSGPGEIDEEMRFLLAVASR